MKAGTAANSPAATATAASLDIVLSVSHPPRGHQRRNPQTVPVKSYLPHDIRTGDVRGLAFKLQPPVHMAKDHRAGHQHDRRGDTAKNETQKPKPCAVGRHDTPLRSCPTG